MKLNLPAIPSIDPKAVPLENKKKLANTIHQIDAHLIDRWGIGWPETWATDIALLKVWEQSGKAWLSLATGTTEQATKQATGYLKAANFLDDNSWRSGHVSREGTEFVKGVLETFPGARVTGVTDPQAPMPDPDDDIPW